MTQANDEYDECMIVYGWGCARRNEQVWMNDRDASRSNETKSVDWASETLFRPCEVSTWTLELHNHPCQPPLRGVCNHPTSRRLRIG